MTEVPELGYPLGISNSELQTFKSCKRKWMLSYYMCRGLNPANQKPTGALLLGSRVHYALQQYYEYGTDLLVALNSQYQEAIEKETFPDYKIDLEKEWDLGRAMLEGYKQWLEETGADEGLEFLAAEANVEVDSGVEGVTLRGRLDARIRRAFDGAHLFMDHKTTGSLTSGPVELLAIDEQMLTYCLLEYLDAVNKTGSGPPEPTDGGIYNMLRKVKRTATAKPPFYDRIEVRHNKQELRSMWLRIHAELKEIIEIRRRLDAGEDHRYVAYPRPSGECTWRCPFLPICPMLDDGSRWQEMLDSHYVIVDPYKRYSDEKQKGALEK